MTTKPTEIDITIYQGASFHDERTWQTQDNDDNLITVDLTGYTARMQVRLTKADTATILDLDTGTKGGITLTGQAGTIIIDLTPTQTDALNFVTAVYDLEMVWPDGIGVTRLFEGNVILSKEVTR